MSQQHKPEPFGYFKAEPFGWTDCAETDEGAWPLYDQQAIDDLVRQRDELTNQNVLLKAHVELYSEEAYRLDDLSTDYAQRLAHWIEKFDAVTKQRDELALIIATDTGTESVVAELQRQRDELLAACEGLMKAHRITVSTRPPETVEQAEKQLDAIRSAVAAAEKAIASVKGGT